MEARSADALQHGVTSDMEVEKSLTENQSVFTLVSAVLSAGALGMPFAFRSCGLGLATVLVLVMLVATELSMRLLMVAGQIASKRSYEELARHSFGRLGQWVVELSVIANNVGSLVAYKLILADLFSTVAGTIIPAGAEPNRNALLLSITLLGVLPVALFVRSPQLLSSVSQASVGFLLFFCVIITCMALGTPPASWHVSWWKWEGALVAFPVVVYSFTAHQALFPIYSTLQRPNLKKMISVIQRSMALSSSLYIVVGACGYVTFGNKTSGNIVRNFGGRGIAGIRLGVEWLVKAGYGVSILATIPLLVIPLHSAFAPWVSMCMENATHGSLTHAQENIITLSVLGASCAMAILLPNVLFVFGLAGSTASVLISFIMPAAIFLRTTGTQRGMLGASVDMLRGSALWHRRRRMAAALLAFGVASGFMCTHALVSSIQEEAEVVQLAQELVREEARVVKATEAELRARQVAEAVGAVSEAAKQLDSAKQETAATLGTVVAVAEHLQRNGTSGSSRKDTRQAARAGLKAVRSEVDKTLQALEAITATLAVTASKLQNATANSTMPLLGAKALIVGNSSKAATKEHLPWRAGSMGSEQQRQQQQQERNNGGDDAPLTSLAMQAEIATEQAVARLLGGEASEKELREVAGVLAEAQQVSNDTLAMLRRSKDALDEAQRIHGADKVDAVERAVRQAVEATAAAAARVNATVALLTRLESEKTSELLNLVHKLADEQEDEEEATREREHFDLFVAGRKQAIGLGGESGGGRVQDVTRTSTMSSVASEKEAKALEALKEIKQACSNSTSPGVQVNVTHLAATVEEVAKSKLERTKETVEKTIEAKKTEVAERALEIAKQLTEQLPQAEIEAGKKGDIISHAAEHHAEKVARQEAAANGTLEAGRYATDGGGSSSSKHTGSHRRRTTNDTGSRGHALPPSSSEAADITSRSVSSTSNTDSSPGGSSSSSSSSSSSAFAEVVHGNRTKRPDG